MSISTGKLISLNRPRAFFLIQRKNKRIINRLCLKLNDTSFSSPPPPIPLSSKLYCQATNNSIKINWVKKATKTKWNAAKRDKKRREISAINCIKNCPNGLMASLNKTSRPGLIKTYVRTNTHTHLWCNVRVCEESYAWRRANLFGHLPYQFDRAPLERPPSWFVCKDPRIISHRQHRRVCPERVGGCPYPCWYVCVWLMLFLLLFLEFWDTNTARTLWL